MPKIGIECIYDYASNIRSFWFSIGAKSVARHGMAWQCQPYAIPHASIYIRITSMRYENRLKMLASRHRWNEGQMGWCKWEWENRFPILLAATSTAIATALPLQLLLLLQPFNPFFSLNERSEWEKDLAVCVRFAILLVVFMPLTWFRSHCIVAIFTFACEWRSL